jgi:para-nitrobenzyl esterase
VDPRPRALRGQAAAREHFVRATAARKVVETKYGALSGYAANASTWQWLGVRYAKPPLGDLRWKPPVEPDTWAGTRDAVAWGDQAPQNPRFEANGEGGMSEDSLHLNVTAPENARDLPVMVWFHGGAFTILTANSRGYNNLDGLTTKGVVLVTVNHRLGPFGYLAHPLLTADSTYGGSGNYARWTW